MKETIKTITKEQYEAALSRIEELIPLVGDETPTDAPESVELVEQSAVVIAYEKEHYPISTSTQPKERHAIQTTFTRKRKVAVL